MIFLKYFWFLSQNHQSIRDLHRRLEVQRLRRQQFLVRTAQPLWDPFVLQAGQVQALQQILGLDRLTVSEPAKGKVSRNYNCSLLRYHSTENEDQFTETSFFVADIEYGLTSKDRALVVTCYLSATLSS